MIITGKCSYINFSNMNSVLQYSVQLKVPDALTTNTQRYFIQYSDTLTTQRQFFVFKRNILTCVQYLYASTSIPTSCASVVPAFQGLQRVFLLWILKYILSFLAHGYCLSISNIQDQQALYS